MRVLDDILVDCFVRASKCVTFAFPPFYADWSPLCESNPPRTGCMVVEIMSFNFGIVCACLLALM